jgi:hypothetical protein
MSSQTFFDRFKMPVEAVARGQNSVSGNRRIASHRRRCTHCSGAMWLTRIAPDKRSEGFRLEYLFECPCGAKITIAEADLWQ